VVSSPYRRERGGGEDAAVRGGNEVAAARGGSDAAVEAKRSGGCDLPVLVRASDFVTRGHTTWGGGNAGLAKR
jgi:hypothetical protein